VTSIAATPSRPRPAPRRAAAREPPGGEPSKLAIARIARVDEEEGAPGIAGLVTAARSDVGSWTLNTQLSELRYRVA
jgi:hypothetical protein